MKTNSSENCLKTSDTEKETCIFPFSFSLHENEFIRNLPQNVRSGLTLAKALRIDSVVRQHLHIPEINRIELEQLKTDDVITTYMLKTCLFFLYAEQQNSPKTLQANSCQWSEMIYQRLRKCIAARKLETYYGDGVLFQCGDHTEDDKVNRVCCQRRLLILRMCDAILKFLGNHRTELQV